jgi:hypothetical protein
MKNYKVLTRSANWFLFLCMQVLFWGITTSPVSGQQIKLNSGDYLINSGAYVVVTGRIDNSGSITNNGTAGFTNSGDWQNAGTFVAGPATHQIGGNFSNNGVFTGTGSTFTFNGTIAQTIGGTSATTFNNLIIDNSAGVTLTSSALTTVSGILSNNTGSVLSLAPGNQLTASGILTNNGTLNLHSDETRIFSLMMNSYSGSGTANIEMYLTGAGSPNYKWHYVAVPENLSDKTVFTSINSKNLLRYDDSEIPDGTDHTNYEGWIWHDGYKTGDTEGGPYSGTAFTTLEIGRGYNFYHTNTFTVAVFSNLHSLQTTLGPLSLQYNGSGKIIPATYGLNLLGNSLTCGIDWNLVTAASGDMGNAVYYTTDNKLGTYLRGAPAGINGASKDIPPLQGFFVKTSATGTSLDFSAAREHTTQVRYKKGDVTADPMVMLELNKSGNQDETLIWFNEKATNSFDGSYDALKLFSAEAGYDQIYTVSGSEKLGINGIPFPSSKIIIPVGVRFLCSGSDYKIIASQIQGLDDYKVTLTDKGNANITVDLKKTDRYSFSSEAGIFTDRFFLTITNILTDVPDIIVSDRAFNIFVINRILNIELLKSEWEGKNSTICIYDPEGRKVIQQNNVEWYSGERKQIPLNISNGIYIVEIKADKLKFVSKIIMI